MSHTEEFATLAAKRYDVRGKVNPIAAPLYSSSIYVLDNAAHGAALCNRTDLNGASPYLYTRWGNPTNDIAEQAITALEGGHSTFVTASGMAAISTSVLSFLKSGDHAIFPACAYGGTQELAKGVLPSFGIEVTFVDSTDIKNYEAAIKPNTKVLYGETPSNPTLAITDLAALGQIGKKHKFTTIVDNTFASPYHQRPIADFGIEIVVHSATKYLGGHSDLVAGSITVSNDEQAERIFTGIKLFGGCCAPQVSILLQRGIKTLDVRMQRHNSNALAIAKFLEKHPKIAKVNYPGLASHPQHELAKKQMKNGFGGMISFEIKGGKEAGRIFVEALQTITLAVSLGGIESLVEHPATMTHYASTLEEKARTGISDGLVRLSVGIEGEKDLISDLSRALDLVTI
eukprot:Phypoly_transcript_10210.p1 GENE.Phypoly_transcript_10210~~Phypoly_transcript_10210.p1  ORF type:complete len:401 (+),score=77.25 Phypoly_transcript_10210:111-1313(+)